MKTRSSSGVGQKIDLDFDIDTLRITNSDEQSDDGHEQTGTRSSQILNDLKRNSTVSQFEKAQPREGFDPFNPAPNAGRDDPAVGVAVKPQASIASTKLRELINNLPGDDF
jgi:hypothetical protein